MTERDEALAALRMRFDASYSALWQSMLSELADGTDDRLWLTAAASYLFRTTGVRWAVDPVFRHPAVIDAINAGRGRALERLSFALYTHEHNDHVHLPTIQAMAGLPMKWVVPHFMRDKIAAAGVSADRLVHVRAGERVEIDGVTIRAFDGRHYDAGTRTGVESLWYAVEAGGRRVFLPGDVRDYDLSRMPAVGKVDNMCAHVWLGRKNALNSCPEPFLTQFAAFIAHVAPSRVFLAHLYELRRNPNDMWTRAHGEMVAKALAAAAPAIRVVMPDVGRGEEL